MTGIFKKLNKPMALFLIALLAVSTIAVTANGMGAAKEKTDAIADEHDRLIAGDISGMTGIPVEEVLSLRRECGGDWNKTLEKLKGRNAGAGSENKRNSMLLQADIGDEFLKKLRQEGFSDNEILEAKAVAERVAFQLNEVASGDRPEAQALNADEVLDGNGGDSGLEAYRQLAGEFDYKTCLFLLLKLKGEFGSLQKVMDEYLCALQLGLELETYLIDGDAYTKQKNEKSAAVKEQDIITVQKIEEKLLSELQKNNTAIRNKGTAGAGNSPGPAAEKAGSPDMTPDPVAPLPETGSVKPPDPAGEILDEINALDPLKNNR